MQKRKNCVGVCLIQSVRLSSPPPLSLLVDRVQEWFDHKLKWNPNEYGGIEDINLPAEQIWLPDIVLYNR